MEAPGQTDEHTTSVRVNPAGTAAAECTCGWHRPAFSSRASGNHSAITAADRARLYADMHRLGAGARR